ncbi:MAG: hypothetical protein JXL84_05390 [Deltaproteobacteria bacterium]|nr:hypothetical protein [Deltaproteobacteria bacterium]
MNVDRVLRAIHFNRLRFLAAGCILAVLILGIVLIRNAERNTLAELHALYDAERKSRMPDRRGASTARSLQTQEDIRRFLDSLPERLTFPETTVEIFQALQRRGLPTISMTYRPESIPLKGLTKYSTSFTVNGPYAALKGFLADIQNSKNLFCIEGITLTNQSKGEELVSLNIRLAFYLRQTMQAGTPNRVDPEIPGAESAGDSS